MSVLGLLSLLGLCLATTVLAREVPLVSESSLAALDKLLAESELEVVEAHFVNMTDTEDETRFWNPFAWASDVLSNQCKCEGSLCDCCFTLDIFAKTACLTAEVGDDKKIHITFKLDDTSLFSQSFDIERENEFCGRVPVTPLNFLNFCFREQTLVADDETISYCTNVDFKVIDSIGATIQFTCLEFKDGQLTVGGYPEVEASQLLVLKAKNPFTMALELYNQVAG